MHDVKRFTEHPPKKTNEDLLSFQVAQVVQPPLMDLEVPEKKQHHDGMSEGQSKRW